MPLHERSYAKVNLFLHVLGKIANGYHELESLVYFPESYFDEITVEQSIKNELTVSGKYAPALHACGADIFENNIISKTISEFDKATGLKTPALKVILNKNLFVAGGIGGGSGNAAAILRILNNLHETGLTEAELAAIGLKIGADVPVCVYQRPSIFRGVGEKVELLNDFPKLMIELLNPGVAVNTVDIFKMGFKKYSNPVDFSKYDMTSERDVLQLLSVTGNDLQPNALKLRPEIEFLLEEMSENEEYKFVGMSGSGGTCFAIK